MGKYKGNVGHLVQHWTLCELLVIAGKKHTSGLSFIDAHAMAPLAKENHCKDAQFTRVEAGLSNNPESVYEQAWHDLTPNGGYPNSAAFVKKVWEGDFSLLLYETDCSTIKDLRPWCECVRELVRCKSAKVFPGDWRDRFDKGLPSPSEVGLADGSLTLLSFDPYMYNRHRVIAKQKEGNLYPADIERALHAMRSPEGGILIQLSTYTANGNNPQGAVISSVNSILTASHFTLPGVVRVNNKMMSLVYARNVSWSAELAGLPSRFEKWLSKFKCQPSAHRAAS